MLWCPLLAGNAEEKRCVLLVIDRVNNTDQKKMKRRESIRIYVWPLLLPSHLSIVEMKSEALL